MAGTLKLGDSGEGVAVTFTVVVVTLGERLISEGWGSGDGGSTG